MRKTTIRLSDRLWDLIQAEARAEGVTAAQYIREAVIARIYYEQGLREAGTATPAQDAAGGEPPQGVVAGGPAD